MGKKLVILGWYGIPNMGAEAILQQMLYFLKNDFEEITVLSWNPEYTSKNYNVKSVSHFSTESFRAIKNTDVFILGGGDLIDGAEKGFLFWLSRPYLSKLLQKKLIISAIGVRPMGSGIRKFIVRKILKRADLLTVRDKCSHNLLKELGLKNVQLVADPAFLLKPAPTKEVKKILKKYGTNMNKNMISVSLRPWLHQRMIQSRTKIYEPWKILEPFPNIFDSLIDMGYQVIFIPMQISRFGDDIDLIRKIYQKMENKDDLKIISNLHPPEKTKAIFKQTDMLIGMRLHPLIFASSEHVPTVAISHEFASRIKNFHHEIGLDRFTVDLNELSSKKITDLVEKAMSSKKQIKNMTFQKIKILERRAKKNFELIKEVVG